MLLYLSNVIQCYPYIIHIIHIHFKILMGIWWSCCSLFVKGEFFMVSAICSPICRDPQLSLDLLPPPAACVDQNYGWFRRILQNSKCSKCRINRNSQFWVKYGWLSTRPGWCHTLESESQKHPDLWPSRGPELLCSSLSFIGLDF